MAGSLPNEVANATSGDHITFALSPSCSTITLTSQLDISGLTIVGPGAGSLAVDGGGSTGALLRVERHRFHLRPHHPERVPASDGGAIEQRWHPDRDQQRAHRNNASIFGGAIDSIGTLTVTNTTLSGNGSPRATRGRGIENTGTLTVDNSTLSDNTADQYGGGIESLNATLTVDNTTVRGNSAPAIPAAGSTSKTTRAEGTSTIENTTFWGNSAGFGGGIQDDSGHR